MKKRLAVFAIAFWATPFALAGVEAPQDIYVEHGDDYVYAQGDLVTVRFSTNENAFIGCGTRTIQSPDGPYSFAFCQAGSAADEYVACQTEDPDMIAKIASLDGTSFIAFEADAKGVCDFLATSTQSFYLHGSLETKK